MTATPQDVTAKKKPEQTAEAEAAVELVRQAREQGPSTVRSCRRCIARDLTTGEITAHFAEIYGAPAKKEMISPTTDKLIEETLHPARGPGMLARGVVRVTR